MENLTAFCDYLTTDNMEFRVEIYHKKYARKNYYKLYKHDEVCAEGNVPTSYTPRDIFNYWVRDEGTIKSFKEVS